METLEELKAIIENAPDDASSVDAEGYYIKFSNGSYYCCASKLDSWRRIEKSELLTTRSLSDIKRIVELMEINAETQKQRASSSEAYGKFINNMGRDHKLDLMLSNSIVNQCINLGHVSGMSEVETLKFAIAAMIKLSDDDLKNKIDLAMRRVNPYSKGAL